MSHGQRSSSITDRESQSVTLWFDEEKNKHYLVNNETGAMKQVMKTGDYIRRFDVRCTGSKSFKERLEFSQNNIEYAPNIPKSLKMDATKSYYAPVPEKWDGYTQFRCPRGNPWDNQIMVKDKKQNPETIRRWIDHAKTSLDPRSLRNTGIWDKNRTHYQHLTAPLNKYETLRSKSPELLKAEMTKNNWLPPHTAMLEKSIMKIKEKAAEEQKSKDALDIIKEQNKPVNINTIRYQSKVTNTENKTIRFPEGMRETQSLLRTYADTKENESLNLTDLARNLDKYKTQTFNRHLTFKKAPFESNTDMKLKTETDFLKKLNREKQEMKGFEISPEKERNSLLTKGRFGTVIPTEGIRYREDRQLMKTMNPDLYVVKENKSAKMRRAALDFQKAPTDALNIQLTKEQTTN